MNKRLFISAMLVLALLTTLLISGLSVSASQSSLPGLPKDGINYALDVTADSASNAVTWNDHVLTLPNGTSATLKVDGVTSADNYVLSFWTKLPAGLGAWSGAVGVTFRQTGTDTQKLYFMTNVAQYFNAGGVEAERFIVPSTGAGVPAGEWVNVAIQCKPTTEGGGTWMRFFINGEAMNGTWGSPNCIDGMATYDPQFTFGAAGINLEIKGIRVYKVDEDATQFEADFDPAGTHNTPGGVSPNGGSTTTTVSTSTTTVTTTTTTATTTTTTPAEPAVPTLPGMPKGADNLAAGVEAAVSGGAVWEDGVLTLPDGASATLDIDGVTSADNYVLSFWTKLPAGLGAWSGAVGVTFRQTGTDTQKLYFMTNVAQYFNAGGVEAERFIVPSTGAGVPAGEWVNVAIQCKPTTEGGGTWMRFFINGEAMNGTWGSPNCIDGMATYDPQFTFGAAGINLEIKGVRVYKVDETATEFEKEFDPEATVTQTTTGSTSASTTTTSSSDGDSTTTVITTTTMTTTTTVTPAAPTVPGMPKDADNLAAGVEAAVSGGAVWKDGVLTLPNKASATLDIDGVTSADNYVLSFWTKLPAGLTAWNGGVNVTFRQTGDQAHSLNMMTNLASFSKPEGEAERMILPSTGAGMLAGKWVKVDIQCKPTTAGGGTWMRFFINGEAMKGTWGSPDCIDGMATFDPQFTFAASGVDLEIKGIRVYKVDETTTEFEADFDPEKQEDSDSNPSTGHTVPLAALAVAAASVCVLSMAYHRRKSRT